MRRKILITGGSGLLAVNWALTIRDVHDVTLGLHSRSIAINGVNTCHIDLETVDTISRILDEMRFDLVVHTVGISSVDLCEFKPAQALHVNATLAKNVATACAHQRVQMIHISTDHFFDNSHNPADEASSMVFCNTYARSKAEAERFVIQSLPSSLVIRTNFYGWGTEYRQSFSDKILSALRTNQRPTLFFDVRFSPILIEPLVHAAHDLHDRGAQGVFHLAGDDSLSKYDFGVALAQEFGLDPRLIRRSSIHEMPHLQKRPLDMSLSNLKASRFLGYQLGDTLSHLARLRQQEVKGVAAELRAL